LEVTCGRCGVINGSERIFCLRCRYRLFPVTSFDLVPEDYLYDGDRTNLAVIKDAGWLPSVIAQFRIDGQDRSIRAWLSKSAVSVSTLSDFDLCMRRCGDLLGLSVLPDAFVIPSAVLNAAVMGSERNPILVVTQVALQMLRPDEMTMLVGHELAHVRSRHMLYHTAAESVATGGSLLASFFGGGALSYPLRMSLLAWHRDSEVSADRAAVLLGGDFRAFQSMLTKTAAGNGGPVNGGGISELFRTHPEYGRRLTLANDFYGSVDFARGRDKLRKRAKAGNSLLPLCIHCGRSKTVGSAFCGSCGKSQR
jgi:Peptidase family M48